MRIIIISTILVFGICVIKADDIFHQKFNLWLTQKEPSDKAKELILLYKNPERKNESINGRFGPRAGRPNIRIQEKHREVVYLEAWCEVLIGYYNKNCHNYYFRGAIVKNSFGADIKIEEQTISLRYVVFPVIEKKFDEDIVLESTLFFIETILSNDYTQSSDVPIELIRTPLTFFKPNLKHLIYMNKILKLIETYDEKKKVGWLEVFEKEIFDRIVKPLKDTEGGIVNSSVIEKKYLTLYEEESKYHQKWVEAIKDFMKTSEEKNTEENYKMSDRLKILYTKIIEYKRELIIKEEQGEDKK